MSQRRNRAKPVLSFTDRLIKAALEARTKAEKLKPGKARDDLLEKAREFEAQIQMNTFLGAEGSASVESSLSHLQRHWLGSAKTIPRWRGRRTAANAWPGCRAGVHYSRF
jgi:hypothetical protein